MLWIFLFIGGFGAIIIFLIILIEMFFLDNDWDDIKGLAKRMVILAVVGLIGFFGLDKIRTSTTEETSKTGEWDIVSLTDNSEVDGSVTGGLFYVYCSIDTDEVYSFYYEATDGGIKRGKVDADNTTIYEKEDCIPHVVEYTTYTKNKMNKTLREILAFGFGESSKKSYEIYAPSGSVIRTFSLDAQ